MGDFRKLKVWVQSKNLAIKVYKLTDGHVGLKKDLRFKSQMTSAAVSIASNIAEGDELKTLKQSINHFYIAKGSCAELMTQLIICKEVYNIANSEIDILIRECNHLGIMIYKLIEARKRFTYGK